VSIAAIITDLIAAGTPAELVGRVAEALAARDVVTVQVRDEAAERRRAADRERKANVRGIPQTSADAETGSCDAPLSEVLISSYQKDPLKGVQKGEVSPEDEAAGLEAVAIIGGLRSIPDHAFTAHQSVMAALAEAGFNVVKEVQVETDGDTGRVDVVATKAGGSVAIEIDSRSVRTKSIRKLRRMSGFRIAALRRAVNGEQIEGIHAVVGIDTVTGTAWARGSRLAEDWKPGDRELDYARKAGLSETQIDKEATKFVRHFTSQSGAKGVKLNWFATWQNWIDRAVEFLGVKPPQTERQPAAGAIFIVRGSPQWEAWTKHRGREPIAIHHAGTDGQFMRSEWPPQQENAA